MSTTEKASSSPDNVVDTVLKIATKVANERGVELVRAEVDMNKSLREYDLDSMDLIAIVSDIEDHYDMSLSNEDLDKARCIGDLINVVSRQLVASTG